MKVIRCKNCIYDGLDKCPLAYIENNTLCFVEHSPMFFCAKGRAAEDYKPTKGDAVRNMTDRQLAVWMNEHERDAYRAGLGGGRYDIGEKNIKFYTGFFGSAEGEDYDG